MLLGLEIFPLGLHLSIQFQFRITFGILESQLLIYRNQVRRMNKALTPCSDTQFYSNQQQVQHRGIFMQKTALSANDTSP